MYEIIRKNLRKILVSLLVAWRGGHTYLREGLHTAVFARSIYRLLNYQWIELGGVWREAGLFICLCLLACFIS